MSLSKEEIQEFKNIFSEKYGKELSWEEAEEYGNNLVGYFELLIDLDRKNKELDRRLEMHPQGFQMEDEGIYNCGICGNQMTGEQTWYDQYGLKCRTCQKAVDDGIIPGSICRDKDSRYTMWELERYFNVKAATVRRYIREGKLKARIILRENGRPYCCIIMIGDNIGLLPPKPKGKVVKNEDGSLSVKYGNIKSPFESNHGK